MRRSGAETSIRAMTSRCTAVGGVNLAQGLCQIEPPVALLEQLPRLATLTHTYTPPEGDPGLRESIARKLRKYNGLSVDPRTQLVVTMGATGAFNAALAGLLRPGDGVLLPEPFYPYHKVMMAAHHVVPQSVRCLDDYSIDFDSLVDAIQPNTRAIVICTPGNPSGHRTTADELERLIPIVEKHNLLVITDETYEHIYFSSGNHLSPGSVPGLAERTVTISSLSKTFSIPGWRLGYIAGPTNLVAPCIQASEAMVACAPVPLQQLAIAAMELEDEFYSNLRSTYEKKRIRLTEILESVGFAPNSPDGSYYLMVGVGGLGFKSGYDAGDALLQSTGIAMVGGEEFYDDAPTGSFMRACFSLSEETLDDVASRIERFDPGTR